MVLENANLSREFSYEGVKFYTACIHNKLSNISLQNCGNDEFLLQFIDGSKLASSNMQAVIKQNTDAEIVVAFHSTLADLEVTYSVGKQLLRKQAKIVRADQAINYIDVECLNLSDLDEVYTVPKQADIKEMANFSGYYVELGQPVYIKSFFSGMEFPLGENRVCQQRFFSRYYVGQKVKLDEPKVIWPTILGAACGTDKEVVQTAFYDYIASIAQAIYLRKQYNSWYDHMTDINEENILQSFAAIHKGFNDYGVQLDAYVVDDGWPKYDSFWEFNAKFSNGFTNIKAELDEMNAALGLWIGPRGGYGGTEITMSNWLETHAELGLGSKNKKSNDVNVGDFRYLMALKERMLKLQADYGISYWKIDGWLLKPDTNEPSDPHGMWLMTLVYEFLLKMLTELRQASGRADYWINLTSYVNPSPWFLKWVNSLWLQTSQDVGFSTNAGDDLNSMLTYRDSKYYEFFVERGLQLPLWAIYNHEPIYGKKLMPTFLGHPFFAETEDFEHYLMFIATRGQALFEFYYSHTMFDDLRWQANARAVKWIEANWHVLRHSQLLGREARNKAVYGYYCKEPKSNEIIVSLRNPTDSKQKIQLTNLHLAANDLIIGQEKVTHLADGWVELAPYTIAIWQK